MDYRFGVALEYRLLVRSSHHLPFSPTKGCDLILTVRICLTSTRFLGIFRHQSQEVAICTFRPNSVLLSILELPQIWGHLLVEERA